jgi:flagellin
MIINHNIPSLFAHDALTNADWQMAKTSEKLSSGLRVNRSADDAAGLAISEKMRSQIRGLNMAARNVMDGISLIQTTEGYIGAIQSCLQRVRELAVQAANGIYTSEDRMQIQVEVNQLIDEIDRVASHGEFNTLVMLTGRYGAPTATNPGSPGMVIHMGANMDQREWVHINELGSKALGLYQSGSADRTPISFSTPDNANMALGTLDKALQLVSRERANLGAYQNRLEFAHQAITIGQQNLQASESRIRDTDMASLSIDHVRNNILMQSSTAMLAQSNLRPQLVLQLLR